MSLPISKADLKTLASVKAVFDRKNVVLSNDKNRGDPDFSYHDFVEMFEEVIGQRCRRLSDRFKMNTKHLIWWYIIDGFADSAARSDEAQKEFQFWAGEDMNALAFWCDEWLKTKVIKSLKELKTENKEVESDAI